MFKKLSLFTLIPLAVPLIAWLTHWQWINDQTLTPLIDYPLYFLTETGSTPYALISCVLLVIWLILLTRRHYSWLLIGVVCVVSVLGTQIIKSGLKTAFAEPRPYVEQIMGAPEVENFYQLPRSEREIIVAEKFKDTQYPLIANHRVHETGYSFPSGHTIFAVSWLLLFAGFLFQQRTRSASVAQGAILVWAVLMLVSRLRLGMHFPIDLLTSTLIAWLFHLVIFTQLVPYLQTKKRFQLRGE